MSTPDRLAAALSAALAPPAMIVRAKAGFYDDYLSPLAMPCLQLVMDARNAGLEEIVARAIDGEFDATKEESDAWAASPDGQATMAEFFRGVGGQEGSADDNG